MKYIILIISLIELIACNGSTGRKNVQVQSSIDKGPLPKNNVNALDTASVNDLSFPDDITFMAKVLTTGNFHNDEVWDQADKENWVGLFQSKNGYYVSKTGVFVKRVHDEIADENKTEKTGWEVHTTNKDSSILLFAGLNSPVMKRVHEITFRKNRVYPGESLKFNYLGLEYKLFATGNKKKDQSDPEAFEISNYRLYLEASKNGKTIRQLLVAHPTFDDQMTTLLFAGDIDGDNFVDFIIDTSNHYNATVPTLYLSAPSSKDELLKVVGKHISIGC